MKTKKPPKTKKPTLPVPEPPDIPRSSGRVESVLFLFRGPGPTELKTKIREWAAAQDQAESEIYYEFMTEKLTEFCTPFPSGESPLDMLVSRACEHPMKVHDPEVTYFYDTAHRPALRLKGGSIRSTVQPGVIAYLENKQFVDVLLTAFSLMFLVERIDAQITYDDFIPWSQSR